MGKRWDHFVGWFDWLGRVQSIWQQTPTALQLAIGVALVAWWEYLRQQPWELIVPIAFCVLAIGAIYIGHLKATRALNGMASGAQRSLGALTTLAQLHYLREAEIAIVGAMNSTEDHWRAVIRSFEANPSPMTGHHLKQTVRAFEKHLSGISESAQNAIGHSCNLLLHPNFDKNQNMPVDGEDLLDPDPPMRTEFRRLFDTNRTAAIEFSNIKRVFRAEIGKYELALFGGYR